MTATCTICKRPVPGNEYGCAACAGRARRHLDDIAQLAGPARDVAHGQSRRGPAAVGGHGSEARLPINLGATARIDAASNALTGWARAVWDERGGAVNTGDELEAAARYLAGEVEWIRHQQFAKEAFEDITRAARVVASITEGPAQRRYAGPCECGTDLYARPSAGVARCRTCGAEHDVAERQRWMREQVEDKLARPVEIAGIMLRLGVPLGYSTIAAYVAGGRVLAHGRDEKGRELYRIGDVLDIRMGTRKPRRVG